VSVRRFGGGVRWNSLNLLEILPISKRCENVGKHISGTVVLGYTVSDFVVRRLPAWTGWTSDCGLLKQPRNEDPCLG